MTVYMLQHFSCYTHTCISPKWALCSSVWWWADFCLMATGLMTKWVSVRISWWPTAAADSARGPVWGLGGAGLWTRDLGCLFTFSWLRPHQRTTALLCPRVWTSSCKCVCVKGLERQRERDFCSARALKLLHTLCKKWKMDLWNLVPASSIKYSRYFDCAAKLSTTT